MTDPRRIVIATDETLMGQLVNRLKGRATVLTLSAEDDTTEPQRPADLLITDERWLLAHGPQVMNDASHLFLVGAGHGEEGARWLDNKGLTDYLVLPPDADMIAVAARVILDLPKERGEFTAQDLGRLAEAQRRHQPDDGTRFGPFQLSSYWAPRSGVSGDTFGAIPLSKGRLGVYLVDFAGHGLNAGTNALWISALIRGAAESRDNPTAFLSALSDGIRRKAADASVYASALYVVLDPEKHACHYAAAGVPHPICWRANGQMVFGNGRGVPLGVASDVVYQSREMPFEPGAQLLIYTDGLPAALGKSRQSSVAPEAWIEGQGMLDADGAVKLMKRLVHVPTPLPDDVTAVLISRPSQP